MKNPFEGLKRKRLPGMHLIVACEGGMSLCEALAAHFFLILHDRVKHNCLIEKSMRENKELVGDAMGATKSMDGVVLISISGIMVSSALANEEWSYLDDEDAFAFHLIAGTAVEQVQRWISEGSHEPFKLPLLGGDIVVRPQWAIDRFGTPDSDRRSKSRQYVKKLEAEVEANRCALEVED